MPIVASDLTVPVEPGGTVWAGVDSAWPAWRRGLVAHTWTVVPATNVLADIDPTAGATDIAPPGADFVARGMTAGLFAWTGGVWDDATGTWWMPLGGGHTDYGGNEPYRIRLADETPTWVMVRPPTGSDPANGSDWTPTIEPGTTRDGLETSGVYFDGRLRSVHSYNNQCFVPGLGPVIARHAGYFYTAPAAPDTSRKAYYLDAQGEANLIVDYWSIAGQGSGSANDGAACYDPSRHCVWTVGHGSSRLVQIDLATGVATGRGAQGEGWIASGGAMVYIPSMDVLAMLSIGGLIIVRLDQGSYTRVVPSLSGSYASGLVVANFVGTGFAWCPTLGKLLLYQQSSDTTRISTLTPSDPGDPSAPWVRGTLTVSPSNAVTPPVSHDVA
jgi:hypothetical protein